MSNEEAIRLMKKQKFKEASQLLTQVIENNPQDPIGYINYGNLLIHKKEYDQVERLFAKAIELDPKAATAYYGLGNLYYEQKDFEKSVDKYQTAIKLGLNHSDAYYMLGMSLVNSNFHMHAIPYLLRATELDKDDDDEKLFQYGLALAKSEFLSEAEDAFHHVLKMNEQHSDAYYNLGIISLYHDELADALEQFSAALRIQPNHMLAANGKSKVKKLLYQQKN